ncbi:MAG: hypothetical protein LBP59_13540 [Planctomycetaceae bacterium]|nr:hypothetical protein [Planctomycetaceae bacterium]
MSTTACRRDARDPEVQARRPRSRSAGKTPANLKYRRDACDPLVCPICPSCPTCP